MLVLGGGPAADIVRRWDGHHQFDAIAAHDLAVHAMGFNARLLAASHQRFHLVKSIEDTLELPRDTVPILDVLSVIRCLEFDFQPLPRSWDVTSDSIAAWIADRCGASELLLLKSVAIPDTTAGRRLSVLAESELLDPAFPQFAAALRRIRWCNLRDATPTLIDCLTQS